MEWWKRECRVPGDLDLSDSTAGASTAASTCPSFSSLSLLQSLTIPLPLWFIVVSGMSFHFGGLISPLLLSWASWNTTGPENGKWIPNRNAHSHPLLSLLPSVSRLGLLILPLLPSVLLFLHSPCTHGKFWWDSEQIVHPWKQAAV